MDIKSCYTEHAKREWKRLLKDSFHKLEFDTTMHYLKKYLPKKGLILDAGGGPGRYTIELAKMGHDVVLLDYTPSLLEIAKKEIKKAGVTKKVKDIIEGSITNLSMFKNNMFDAVICLGGPLGHVKSRRKALSELKRVTKKNGLIFVSVIGRIGTLMNAPTFWSPEIKMTEHFKRIVEKGDDYKWHGKYYSHLFLPEELEKMFTEEKIKMLGILALEGISTGAIKDVERISKNRKMWKIWLWAHYRLADNPTVAGLSQHFMIIGRKVR